MASPHCIGVIRRNIPLLENCSEKIPAAGKRRIRCAAELAPNAATSTELDGTSAGTVTPRQLVRKLYKDCTETVRKLYGNCLFQIGGAGKSMRFSKTTEWLKLTFQRGNHSSFRVYHSTDIIFKS